MRSFPPPLLALALGLWAGSIHAQAIPIPDSEVPQRRELLRTSRFAVYLLDIGPGDSTPMHRHDLDIATVFTSGTLTRSTFWGEAPRPDRPPLGGVRFRPAGFTHATANIDTAHFQSVIVEFSQAQGQPDSTPKPGQPACTLGRPDTCARDSTLFCLAEACVHHVTIGPGGSWPAGGGAALLVYVTPAALTATDSTSGTVHRARTASSVDYDPAGAPREWRNEGAIATRLIAFVLRPPSPSN